MVARGAGIASESRNATEMEITVHMTHVCSWLFNRDGDHSAYDTRVFMAVQSIGKHSEDFSMGRSKVFIRSPKTVFELEELRRKRVEEIATFIQRMYRGWVKRRRVRRRGTDEGGGVTKCCRWITSLLRGGPPSDVIHLQLHSVGSEYEGGREGGREKDWNRGCQ